jgi:hypothetical protein
VRQFFDEVEFACGVTSNKLQAVDYFSWPITGDVNMNLGEGELIQLLTGFMRQYLTADKKRVVFFGDNAKLYGSSAVSSIYNLQVITAPNLGAMFTSASAKAEFWSKLQALMKCSD